MGEKKRFKICVLNIYVTIVSPRCNVWTFHLQEPPPTYPCKPNAKKENIPCMGYPHQNHA